MTTRMQQLGIDGFEGYDMTTPIDDRKRIDLLDKAQEMYKAEFGYRATLEDLYSWLHEDISPVEFSNYYACDDEIQLTGR